LIRLANTNSDEPVGKIIIIIEGNESPRKHPRYQDDDIDNKCS
jgi:hypothetical protein